MSSEDDSRLGDLKWQVFLPKLKQVGVLQRLLNKVTSLIKILNKHGCTGHKINSMCPHFPWHNAVSLTVDGLIDPD